MSIAYYLWSSHMLCFYSQCQGRLCSSDFLETCIVHNLVDLLYVAILSVLF